MMRKGMRWNPAPEWRSRIRRGESRIKVEERRAARDPPPERQIEPRQATVRPARRAGRVQ